MERQNQQKIQSVTQLFSPKLGKIPLIVTADLMMPSLIVPNPDNTDETDSNRIRSLHFGDVVVGRVMRRNLTVKNLFNETVEIAVIMPVDEENAIFVPSANEWSEPVKVPTSQSKKMAAASGSAATSRLPRRGLRVVLEPYTEGVFC